MYSEHLMRSNQLLSQNEDIIAAIVENLQIGRYSDCVSLYGVLHQSIVNIGQELDNFPEEAFDPYEDMIDKAPGASSLDTLMKRDVLEDKAISAISRADILPPACCRCEVLGNTAQYCRVEVGHTEPSHRLSETEAEEYAQVAQYLAGRCRIEIKPKKVYKRWSEDERYSLLVCVRLFRDQIDCIAKVLGRSESQVQAFLDRHKDDWQRAKKGELPPAPQGYEPPSALGSHFVRKMKVAVNSKLVPKAAPYKGAALETNDGSGLPEGSRGENTAYGQSMLRSESRQTVVLPSLSSSLAHIPVPVFPIDDVIPALMPLQSVDEVTQAQQTKQQAQGKHSLLKTLSQSNIQNIADSSFDSEIFDRSSKRKRVDDGDGTVDKPTKQKLKKHPLVSKATKAPKASKEPKEPKPRRGALRKETFPKSVKEKKKKKNSVIAETELYSAEYSSQSNQFPFYSAFSGSIYSPTGLQGQYEFSGDSMLLPNLYEGGEELSFMGLGDVPRR